MISFQPDQVAFGDLPGMGRWDDDHAREHIQFVQAFAARTPPVLLADYNLLSMLAAPKDSRQSIVESHTQVHNLIAPLIGATAVDFSGFDLDQEGDFYSFLSYHSQTHSQIRAFLGIS